MYTFNFLFYDTLFEFNGGSVILFVKHANIPKALVDNYYTPLTNKTKLKFK